MLRKTLLLAIVGAASVCGTQPTMYETVQDGSIVETSELIDNPFQCIFQINQAYYDLKPLMNTNVDFSVTNPDQAKQTIHFNICKTLITPKCAAQSMAEVRNDADECLDVLTTATQMINVKYSEIQGEVDGLEFRFPPGSFKYNDQPAELKLTVQCAPNTDQISFQGYDGQIVHVTYMSQYGCQVFSTNFVWSWINSQRLIWGGILIAVGIVLGLFGRPLFKPAICLIGTIAIMFVLAIIVTSIFFTAKTPNWAGWVVFAVCLVVGSLGGLILAKLSRLGVGVLAGWGGFLLGIMLYSAFVYRIDNSKHVAFWVFNIALAVIFGVISMFLFDHAIIVATSIIGAYGFIRGISFYAGGYPDEYDLVNNVQIGNWDAIPKTFWAYFAAWVILAIACIVIQFKMWRKKGDEHKHPYHYRR